MALINGAGDTCLREKMEEVGSSAGASVRLARSIVIMFACGDHKKRTCWADSTSWSMCAWTVATFHGTSEGEDGADQMDARTPDHATLVPSHEHVVVVEVHHVPA